MTVTNKIDFSKAKVDRLEPLDSRDSKWVRLQKIQYTDPNGHAREWEFASRTTRVPGSDVDGCGIIAILNYPTGPELLLQKQYRPPVNGVCIEMPAGLLDPNETIEQCAERELLEETGYIGKALSISPAMFNDPGFCNTNLKLVRVDVDMKDIRNQQPQAQLEDGEFIESFSVPLKELHERLVEMEGQGFILDARVQNVAEGIKIAQQYQLMLASDIRHVGSIIL